MSAPRRTLLLLLAALVAAPAPAQGPVPAPPASPDAFVVPATPPPAPIAREEFARRRQALAAEMGDGVLVVMGTLEPDADYLPFAQNAPFRYLTGVTEPNAVLVIAKRGARVDEHLFVMPREPSQEVWQGARLGAEGATRLTGIPSHTTEEMEEVLRGVLAGVRTLYTVAPLSMDGSQNPFLRPDQQFIQQLQREYGVERVADLSDELFTIRQVKSPAELDMLRRSILITTLAHREAMRAVEPGMNEFEIHALIEATFRRYGAERPSFGSIVGSGPNSTTLHYRAADRYMQAGDMLVMDIGASYNGYAADVTRTIPVNGRFSPEQRAVYEIVLAAQKAAEEQARAGVTMARLNQTATRVIAEGLARLGLIESPQATYECRRGGATAQCAQVNLFYMHGLGHGIGLDVHDPEAGYGRGFVAGSAFTIEPGIYVRADALDYLPDTPGNRRMIARLRPAVERYRDIGVRIEDDYFLTEGGLERVTAGAPREIDEIEALMALESFWNRERRPEMVEWYRGITPR
ncbi:MAG: aminopeptidase P N-terminal domain-containing protein [Gemmatimonadetes bacterium]|nr:aminopeptidase P N-terminal domain-containing protein [Gemmatimonadota bacterium]